MLIDYRIVFFVDGSIVSHAYASLKASTGNNVPCTMIVGDYEDILRYPTQLMSDGENVWLQGNEDVTLPILAENVRKNINAAKLSRIKKRGVEVAIPQLAAAFYTQKGGRL